MRTMRHRLPARRGFFAGRYRAALARREGEGTLRSTRAQPAGLVDFASNDYLGLARNADFAAAHFREEAGRADAQTGSGGSRLLTGASAAHDAFEAFAAAFHEREGALLFGSGYAANCAVSATLPLTNDAVLYDERSHNATRFGIKRSRAASMAFRHNDIADVAAKLRDRREAGALICVEGVYSMDGDEAPLQQLAELCLADGRAGLVVDEAHSTGILGPRGAGAVALLPSPLKRAVVAQVHTFGKALGGHGAVVCCDATTREYLANYAQPFIYATAPPASHARLARRAYDAVAAVEPARRRLEELVDLFQAECAVPALLPSRTPIQAVLAPGAAAALRAAERVRSSGFDVRAIRAPTVLAGAERLRVVLHAFNTPEEVAGVARAVRAAVESPGEGL